MPTDPDLALLERLVGDPVRFDADHWGQRSLLRSTGGSFDDLLSVDALEQLLATSARRPTFRLLQDGRTLPPERSTRPVRMAGARLDDVADVARIAEAVDGGATLVVQGLQRTSPEVARLCRSLERAVSHPVQANAYLTPAGAVGLGAHRDDHDVLVLQVAGSKAWEVDDLGPVCTEAGAVLYLPAGVGHAAAAQDSPSLHLTLGILRVTHRQVVQRALAAEAGAALDRPLPLGYARPERLDALHQAVAEALGTVAEVAAATDDVAIAAAEADRARRRRRPLPTGQLRSVLALGRLDHATIVQRRVDHQAALAADPAPDGRLVLELVDRRVLLPAAMGPAVQVLLGDDPVRVGSLPDLDPGSAQVLVRRLVREGLLAVLAEPPADAG